jgi:hypothetical protein
MSGEYRCSGTALQVCDSNQDAFTTVTTCATAGECNATKRTCAPCTAGQLQCNGATLQSCDAKKQSWTNVTTCATPELCNAGSGACDAPACSVGQYQCDASGNLQVCNAGLTGYASVKACGSSALCNAAMHTCEVTSDADVGGPADANGAG